MEKYKLTKESKKVQGRTLFRIRALKSFSNVTKGDQGGWVESEHNLSHRGNCWVDDEACVYGNAHVYGNARISGNARVSGDAQVFENAQVSEYALLTGKCNTKAHQLIPPSNITKYSGLIVT